MLKKRLSGILVLMAGIMLAFSLAGCGDNGDPTSPSGGDGPFTVEFITNGGATISGGITTTANQTIDKNGTVIEPSPISNPNHEDFRGWYTNSGFTGSPYNFSTLVTSDLKLYAKWGYVVGDTGPAGGKIFYVKPGTTTYPTWKYLEAAPAELTNQKMVINGYDDNGADTPAEAYIVVGAKEAAIGTGKSNTQAFIDELEALPQFAAQARAAALAANNVDAYTVNTYSDWFIPSKDELQTLLTSNVLSITTDTHYYWSSTQYHDPANPGDRNDCAWALQFGTGDRGHWNEENKAHDRAFVRPIRSFFCSH